MRLLFVSLEKCSKAPKIEVFNASCNSKNPMDFFFLLFVFPAFLERREAENGDAAKMSFFSQGCMCESLVRPGTSSVLFILFARSFNFSGCFSLPLHCCEIMRKEPIRATFQRASEARYSHMADSVHFPCTKPQKQVTLKD